MLMFARVLRMGVVDPEGTHGRERKIW